MEAMMRQGKASQAGFSMIELLIAIVILAIGLLGLAELQITAMKTNSKSERMLAATALAQEAIEQVTALNEADPMFNANVINKVWPNGSAGEPQGTFLVAGGGKYAVTYDVTVNYQGVTNLCLVRVTVTPELISISDVFSTRAVSMTTLRRAI
jgi:type IV pilus assembly protein PilV